MTVLGMHPDHFGAWVMIVGGIAIYLIHCQRQHVARKTAARQRRSR